MKNENELEYCVIPYVNDVTFGRGEPNQSRPGNVRLKMIVEELLPHYNTLDREGKMEMQNHVVKTIHMAGGRFLSKEAGVWMEVPTCDAKKKVATSFRNRRKVQVKQQKAATTAAIALDTDTPSTGCEKKKPIEIPVSSSTCAISKRVRL